MEELIKKTENRTRRLYIYFWLIAVVLVACGENSGGWMGILAPYKRAAFWTESVVILCTAVCIPLSLKLFATVLRRRVNALPLDKALPLYARWCAIRIGILVIPVVAGEVSYYLFMNNTGLLCAMMALVSSFFCLPGKDRLRRDLHIDQEENV